MCPVGGHGVGGGDGAQSHSTFVCALVAHYTYALYREQYHAGLPYLVIQAMVTEPLDEYMVSFLKYMYFLGGDVAEYAHGQTGTREGMACYQVLRHAELTSYGAYLVLEEQTQGLAELEVHLFRQAAYVVVALDGGAGYGKALNAVRVYGALAEPFHIGEFVGFFIEHFDKSATYDFAFLFGVGHSGKFTEELFRCVNANHVQTEALIVGQHVLELVLTEHSVVHEYAGQVLAYGAVEEHCGY